MSEARSMETQEIDVASFLLGDKENSADAQSGRNQDMSQPETASHPLSTQTVTSPLHSPSVFTPCSSPQHLPSPHSGLRSAPLFSCHSASPPYPQSPGTASPGSQRSLGSPLFMRHAKSVSPRQIHSDNETSSHRLGKLKQRGLKGQSPLQRPFHSLNKGFSLSSASTSSGISSETSGNASSHKNLMHNSLFQRTNVLLARLQAEVTQNGTGNRSPLTAAALSPLPLPPTDVNHNLVPPSTPLHLNQFQSFSPLNKTQEQNMCQDSSPAQTCLGSSTLTLPTGAIKSQSSSDQHPGVLSPATGLPVSAATTENPPALVLPSLGIAGDPHGTWSPTSQPHPDKSSSMMEVGGEGEGKGPPQLSDHIPPTLVNNISNNISNNNSSSSNSSTMGACSLSGLSQAGQIPHCSFAQSYTSLTPWTTRLVSNVYAPLPNPSKETLPVPLGVTDNLVQSLSAKENQLTSEQVSEALNSSYISPQLTAVKTEEQSTAQLGNGIDAASTKGSLKPAPNKELRFKKTADALQKSGLWEVAMKTGNLIRRNRQLQKELDKFRTDALTFLKSVLKNSHNRDLIKSVLNNALASNQDPRKSSPMMKMVVSAAAAAASASAQFSSASAQFSSASAGHLNSSGSTDENSNSGSMSGSASDSSGNNSSAASKASFSGIFAPTKLQFACGSVAMDVN